jgi:hypothetical protein
MLLSGWTRLWIVASVLWWLGLAVVIGMNPSIQPPLNPPPYQALNCERTPPEVVAKGGRYTSCDFAWLAYGAPQKEWEARWWRLGLFSALWLIFPFAVWLILKGAMLTARWVLRGF